MSKDTQVYTMYVERHTIYSAVAVTIALAVALAVVAVAALVKRR